MTDNGYIAVRWNQHRRHGTKLATSEKYRLPAVAPAATRNESHGPASATAEPARWAIGKRDDSRRATTRSTAPASAMTASIEVKNSTASTSTADQYGG